MRARPWIAGLAAGLALASVGAALWSGPREAPASARAIVISARDYRFNGSNPELRFRPGEKVRVVFRNNEATPVTHNFKIVGFGVRCSRPLQPGEEEAIEFTVPAAGEYGYTCCAHPGMGGKVVLGPPK